MPSISSVVVSVIRLSVSILPLISIIAAVPVMVFVVSAASAASVLSGRCSAAVTVSDRGVVSPAPSCGRQCVSGLAGAPLQAGGAEGVEEEALVGAP